MLIVSCSRHSFGYDCKKLFNMVLVNADTLVFASGNFLNYFSISRQEISFQETVYGCGVGFITVSFVLVIPRMLL